MTSQTVIPSIAGGVSQYWRRDFEPFVTRWAGRESARAPVPLPLEGSMGVCYRVREDLSALWARFRGDEGAIAHYLQETYLCVPPSPGFSGSAKPLTATQAEAILAFYKWLISDQPYFFLRKGTKILGLYRKTSGYCYNPTLQVADEPESYAHRFTYEFVRDVLPTESACSSSRIPCTVEWALADLPAPSLDEMVAQLVRIRAAVATLTADIDSALTRFTTAVV